MPSGHDWFLLVWAIVCIVVVVGMSYWVTRFVAGKGLLRGAGSRGGGQIKVLSQELIGKDQRLVLARAGDRYFLLGVTPNAITMLSEFSEEEMARVTADAQEHATQEPTGFFEAFSQVLKERKQR